MLRHLFGLTLPPTAWPPGDLEPKEFKDALRELPSGQHLLDEELEHLANYVDLNGHWVAATAANAATVQVRKAGMSEDEGLSEVF